MIMMMMMIDVLWPLLCTWKAKWAERLPKVLICQPQDSSSGGSDLWSKTLPITQRKRPGFIYEILPCVIFCILYSE